jgi:hypothetical protein
MSKSTSAVNGGVAATGKVDHAIPSAWHVTAIDAPSAQGERTNSIGTPVRRGRA